MFQVIFGLAAKRHDNYGSPHGPVSF